MKTTAEIDLKDRFTPDIFMPNNHEDWVKIEELRNNPAVHVLNEIDSQIADLIKANHPDLSFTKQDLQARVYNFVDPDKKDFFGNWVYYSWKNTLVHILSETDFIRIRTLRNNFKITPQEQKELGQKKVGIVGLSVGQSVALAIALERGCGELRLADFDTLELSNLNRLKAGVTSLGLEKVIIAAREISEIDPYLKLKVFRDGITEDNIDEFISGGGKLDLLIDECDSLDIKVLLREKAKSYHLPVIMETSDRGMLDIERFDQESDRPIFHGMLAGIKGEDLKGLSNRERVSIVLKITGLDTLSLRMKASLLEIGQTIASWPQLASGVFLGGASVAHVGRRLLLGDVVKSGRFYIDFDQILQIDTEEITPIEPAYRPISDFQQEIIRKIPQQITQSAYLLTTDELHEIVNKANQAPSGGNVQPWIWIYDKKGLLHLFHDQERSHSMLDYKGTGSLIAFGAALENVRLISAKLGIEVEIHHNINDFDQKCVATVRFLSKLKSRLDVPYSDLAEGISLRCTNRKNTKRVLLSEESLAIFEDLAREGGFNLKFTQSDKELEKLASIVGGMDRMRLFHQEGLVDFIKEVRWTDEDAKRTKDGIDIATLELSGTEKAAMGLLKDPRTVKFFRKFLMGYGLTKISKDTVTTASVVMVLQGKDFSAKEYLNAGTVLQRIWIKANMLGISFQPVSAMLFIFHRVLRDANHGFSDKEEAEILKLKAEFDLLFENDSEVCPLFMFRLNQAGEPSIRAYRRSVDETLIRL